MPAKVPGTATLFLCMSVVGGLSVATPASAHLPDPNDVVSKDYSPAVILPDESITLAAVPLDEVDELASDFSFHPVDGYWASRSLSCRFGQRAKVRFEVGRYGFAVEWFGQSRTGQSAYTHPPHGVCQSSSCRGSSTILTASNVRITSVRVSSKTYAKVLSVECL